MNHEMVETYRHLRDCAKPISQQDAADLAKVRAPQPPSRAHLARLKRSHEGYAEPKRVVQPRPLTSMARFRMAEVARLQADGGSRTVKPLADGPQRPRVTYVNVELSKRNNEMRYETQAERRAREDAAHEAERRTLARDAIVSYGKRVYDDYQPDMLEVLDLFGSYAEYSREIGK